VLRIKEDNFYEELERVFDQFPKCHMKMLLGDFNAKERREVHETSNDNGVRVVNFATSKNLVVRSRSISLTVGRIF
jgi:hypothetical protein